MSFKIFSLQLLGKIKPAEKIEQQREVLYRDYLEFQETAKSEELAELRALEKEVNSPEFKNRKTEIKSLDFKGSKEYNLLKEYEKLKKAKHIRNYFKAVNSPELKRYETLKDSEKMNEFRRLFQYVKEGDFQKERKDIKSIRYKGSEEERKRKEFKKLTKSKEVKKYLHLPEPEKQSKADSYNIKRYHELKTEVESPQFRERENYLKDNRKFEKSEAYQKWKRFKELSSDSDVKFVLRFGKSTLYKNYLDVKDSADLQRYRELEETVSSEEFRKRKAYLEDKKKWEKSDEYAKEQKYQEMKKRPRIEQYFRYEGTAAFNFFEEWEVSFRDDFKTAELNHEKWSALSHVSQKLLNENYSLAGDLNIFTSGKNIKTGGGRLIIETRKEKTAGKIWNPAAGFIPVELDYSSGLISTANIFSQGDGIFEAKIKFNPVKQVVSSFYLQGEQNVPRINLLEMGAKNRLGISKLDEKNKVVAEGLDISNLKKNVWYILTLEKKSSQFTWKINETEVLEMDDSRFVEPLHLNASTLVVDEVPGSKLPVHFEIDWVRCYRRR